MKIIIDTQAFGIPWTLNTNYRIAVEDGAFIDSWDGELNSEILNAFEFTTNPTGPTIFDTSPQNNTLQSSKDYEIEFIFDRDITLNDGNVKLYQGTSSSATLINSWEKIDCDIHGNRFYINTFNQFDLDTDYFFTIDPGFIVDTDTFASLGVSDDTIFAFHTSATVKDTVELVDSGTIGNLNVEGRYNPNDNTFPIENTFSINTLSNLEISVRPITNIANVDEITADWENWRSNDNLLTVPVSGNMTNFGNLVVTSIDDLSLIVSSPAYAEPTKFYVYNRVDVNSPWNKNQDLSPATGFYPLNVGASRNTLALGMQGTVGSNDYDIYIYRRSSTANNFSLTQILNGSTAEYGEYSQTSPKFSADANVLVLIPWNHNGSGNITPGTLKIYEWNGSSYILAYTHTPAGWSNQTQAQPKVKTSLYRKISGSWALVYETNEQAYTSFSYSISNDYALIDNVLYKWNGSTYIIEQTLSITGNSYLSEDGSRIISNNKNWDYTGLEFVERSEYYDYPYTSILPARWSYDGRKIYNLIQASGVIEQYGLDDNFPGEWDAANKTLTMNGTKEKLDALLPRLILDVNTSPTDIDGEIRLRYDINVNNGANQIARFQRVYDVNLVDTFFLRKTYLTANSTATATATIQYSLSETFNATTNMSAVARLIWKFDWLTGVTSTGSLSVKMRASDNYILTNPSPYTIGIKNYSTNATVGTIYTNDGLYQNGGIQIGFTCIEMNNDFIVIGIRNKSNLNGYDGVAYVYNTTNGNFVRKLDSPNPIASGNFGTSVAINNNNKIAVATEDELKVYIFNSDGTLYRTFNSPDTSLFGLKIAMNNNYIAITGNNVIYVYSLSTGNLTGTINPSSGYALTASNNTLDMNDERIIASSYKLDESGVELIQSFGFNGSLNYSITEPLLYSNVFGIAKINANYIIVNDDGIKLQIYNQATGTLDRTLVQADLNLPFTPANVSFIDCSDTTAVLYGSDTSSPQINYIGYSEI